MDMERVLCHSITWTPSKLYGKNHILFVLVNHHTDPPSKIIFNDLSSDSMCVPSLSLKENWFELQMNLLHSNESNVLFQLLEHIPRWTYQNYKKTINCIFYSYLKAIFSIWNTEKELENFQNISNFNTP